MQLLSILFSPFYYSTAKLLIYKRLLYYPITTPSSLTSLVTDWQGIYSVLESAVLPPLIANIFKSSAHFKSSLDAIRLCQEGMTHSFAVPHKVSAWVAVACSVIENEVPKMTNAHQTPWQR